MLSPHAVKEDALDITHGRTGKQTFAILEQLCRHTIGYVSTAQVIVMASQDTVTAAVYMTSAVEPDTSWSHSL